MTIVKPALALLGKELGHHGVAVVVAAVFVGAGLAIQWFVALEDAAPTLMSAATNLVYYGFPLLALWLNERLVVADRTARTHEFLAALPVAPVTRDALRAVLGAMILVALSTVVLVLTALVATRREGVPLLWWLQLWVQTTAVVLAWHGVSFGVAHLGRWRWLAWWGWFMLAGALDAWLEMPWRTLWWTAPLADPIDQARSLPPWDALPLAAAWAVGGYALGLALSSWRAGALPARWFEPPTAVQRATVVGAGTLMAILGTQAIDLVPPDDRWTTLPAVSAGERAVVRVAGGQDTVLHDVGVEAAAVLDRIGAEVGVERWPPLVLLRSRSEEGRAVRVAEGEREDVSHVLLVDPDVPSEVLVRGVVTEALLARATEVARHDADAWPLYGAAAWLRPDDTTRMRAGRARDRFAPGTAWPDVLRMLGPTVAEGAAWAGLRAIEREAGEDAVWDSLRALVGPRRSERWPGTARLWWTTRFDAVPRWTGLSAPDLHRAWRDELARHDAPPAPPLPTVSLSEIEGEIVASWSGDTPEGTVLRWTILDPLERTVLPGAEIEEVEVAPGEQRRPLPVDPRAKVLAELAVFDPPLQGRATTGWEAARR